MATVKKSVKKAADGSKQPPTYKNLKMGVENSRKGSTPTKQDSALYRFGYNRGLRGEKEYPNEPPIQKMGRWEGQNVGKTAPKKKAKTGGSFPDLNKDGKITKKDILIGKGVLPKTAKKGMKVKKASFGDFMKGAIKMGSKIKGAADSARGAIGSAVLGMPGAKPIAKKGMKMKKAKTGISVPKNTSVSKNIGNLNKAKKGASIKKCKYGCK